MVSRVEIDIPPDKINDLSWIKAKLSKQLSVNSIFEFVKIKSSLDARQKNAIYRCVFEVYIDEAPCSLKDVYFQKDVSNSPLVHIIGSGPAGLFAALTCIENNLKPVIIDRGKPIEDRKKDIVLINRGEKINVDSNWCYGEGGAGTYTDGKLFTRSTKRGNVDKVLRAFVQFGATKSILEQAHPHIGTDVLPDIVKKIRNFILACGGQFIFNTRIIDAIIKNCEVVQVIDQFGIKHDTKKVILAVGNSGFEIFEWMNNNKLAIQSKPFAVGVRIELPQEIVNRALYKNPLQFAHLPPAEFKLKTQIGNKAVFSFCMCPGGIVVPATTHSGLLVVNGMSNSKRTSNWANSGIVITVNDSDFVDFNKFGPLKGLMYQKNIEQKAWNITKSLKAPAQKSVDFVLGKVTTQLNKSSYNPNLESCSIAEIFQSNITIALKAALIEFEKKIKGIYSSETLLIAPESRTSSPIKIPRKAETYQHIQVNNLYPCGEGAGYSGGITSSAIDGINCVEAICRKNI